MLEIKMGRNETLWSKWAMFSQSRKCNQKPMSGLTDMEIEETKMQIENNDNIAPIDSVSIEDRKLTNNGILSCTPLDSLISSWAIYIYFLYSFVDFGVHGGHGGSLRPWCLNKSF